MFAVESTFDKIYSVVKTIPKGKVSTYKAVALLCNTSPRVVGFALHANKSPAIVPCHRIIKSDGTLANGYAFGGQSKQREMLEKENICFEGEKVNLTKYGFNFLSKM